MPVGLRNRLCGLPPNFSVTDSTTSISIGKSPRNASRPGAPAFRWPTTSHRSSLPRRPLRERTRSTKPNAASVTSSWPPASRRGSGEQIRLDRALGTTTPDVIYRAPHHAADEGVCIYLDGLSGHIHGNAATAEQDRQIRAWPRTNGYETIEIVATELHDAAAMTRHFRRLAGYLGATDLRNSLRADASWFERTAPAAAPRPPFAPSLVRPRPEERFVGRVPFVPLRLPPGLSGNHRPCSRATGSGTGSGSTPRTDYAPACSSPKSRAIPWNR